MAVVNKIRVVVCLGTQETLGRSHGVGHALIEAITKKEICHVFSTPSHSLFPTAKLASDKFLLDYPEHSLTVVPGIPSTFFGAKTDISARAKALADHLHQKIVTDEEEQQKIFLYGYSRGCLILLKTLHQLKSKLTLAELSKLQIHLLFNDPVPGGVSLTKEELSIPDFIKKADVIYLKHEQRFFFEPLTGLYSLDKKTKTTITFLDGNHSSATRATPSEIGLSALAVDEITHIASRSLQQLGYQGDPLPVFELRARGEKPQRRPMSPAKTQLQDEELFHQKAAAAEREKNKLRYFPKSKRFPLTKELHNELSEIFHGFDTDLYQIKSILNKKIALLAYEKNAEAQFFLAKLKCLLLINDKMSLLRKHIEKAKNTSNQILIAENFKPCLDALEKLTDNIIKQQEADPEHLEQLLKGLNTIAKNSKHQSEIRRIALLICKIIVSIIPPVGLFLAYHGMFNYKTQTTLHAENILSEAHNLSKLQKAPN